MRHRFMIVLLALLLAGTAAAATINVPADQPTIQAAITAASAGDDIVVASGTYAGGIVINKWVTLTGAGPTTVIQATGATGPAIRLAASGFSASQPILIKDLKIQVDHAFGISVGIDVNDPAVANYVSLDHVDVVGTNPLDDTEAEMGLAVNRSATLSYLSVVDCSFSNVHYGWYSAMNPDGSAWGLPSNFDHVTVVGTSILGCVAKGAYLEKLDQATFTNCTFSGNGHYAAYWNAPWNAGFDLNLKGQAYGGITFDGCTFTNNGLGARHGVGLALKARDDGSTYGVHPASLDDVLVENCIFTGNERGVRIGEPGKSNSTPTDVVIVGSQLYSNVKTYGGIDGSLYGDLVMFSDAPCNAIGNWWGDLNPADQINIEAGEGAVTYAPWLGAAPAVPATWYVGPGYTIQAAIDYASPGDIIQIGAGTYNERPVVAKSLTITGVDEASVIIDAGAATTGDYGFTISANNVSVSNLTLVGNNALSTPRYGFKPSSVDDFVLSNVTARNFYRTGIDLLGVNGGTLTNVVSIDNGGHGLALTDCNNVSIVSLTVNGNAWQGVSVATWGRYSPLGTSGIVFSGTNSFLNPFQLEMGDYNNPGVPPAGEAIITCSTNALDMADVTVQASELAFAVHGEQDDGPGQARVWLAPTLEIAAALPASPGPVGHFTGNGIFIENLVNNSLLLVTPGCSIQAAIDYATTGDTIEVSAGTFVEQLHASGKNLTVRGAGPGVTIVQSPTTLVPQYTTTYPHYAVFCAENGNYVVEDLTIDGAGNGNGHYRFIGLDLHNAGGRVENANLIGVRETPFSGNQHGVALYAYNQSGGPRDLDVIDCTIADWQKNATVFTCDDGFPLTVTVSGCDLIGAGPTGVTAQNGFQFYGADVTAVVDNNEVTGVGYTGSGWVATAILNFYSDLTLTDNTVSNSHTCVYNIDGPALIQGNTVNVQKIGSYGYGIVASDPIDAVPSPYDPEAVAKAHPRADKAILTAAVLDNEVVFIGPDNVGTVGIEADAGFGPNDLAVTINHNIVRGFDYGIAIGQCTSNCDTGVFTNVDARYNSVADNTSFGVWSDASYLTVDARNCWWGSPSGPSSVGPGSGTHVTTFVNFDPWRTGVIVPTPDPLDLSIADPSGDIEVSYLGGVGPVYGYSIEVKWSTAVATATFSKPDSGPFAAGDVTFLTVPIPGGVRVDAALFGNQPGILSGPLFKMVATAAPGSDGTQTVLDLNALYVNDYQQPPVPNVPADDGVIRVDVVAPVMGTVLVTDTTISSTVWIKNGDVARTTTTVVDGATPLTVTANLTGFGGGAAVAPTIVVGDLYTWDFTVVGCVPADGPVTVTVTATDILGNTTIGSDTITADNTLPTPLTGVVALPGHEKIHLSWNNAAGNDVNYAGVEFRYVGRGDYPQYVNPIPSYPATHAAGALALVATGSAADWAQVPRDIYYLAGFVYDLAGNYSPTDVVPTNRGAATNYWLGDVRPSGTYNGLVNTADISALGNCYGKFDGDPLFEDDCDVGPTDTWSSFGRPTPDNEIGFFDLMIFAMNYGEVGPLLKSNASGATPSLAWHQIDETSWALALNEECPGLKGLNISAELPAGVTCQVQEGDLLTRQGARFLKNIPEHGLDAGLAVLGQNVSIEGAGDLVVVTFSAPVTDLDLVVQARDTENTELLVDMSGATGVELPTIFSLGQNYPNPFNPQTTINFALPRNEHVRLAVYSVDGARVRTLVDEAYTAGAYSVVWDGRDSAGRTVATGTYFYKIDAGDFHQVRKMVLMK